MADYLVLQMYVIKIYSINMYVVYVHTCVRFII